MKEHINNLQNIGLNKNQTKVYLASLALGQSTVVELSKKTGVVRTTIYDNLRVLKGYGLITEIIDEAGKTLFIPENPKQLLNTIEDKKQRIMKESIPGLLQIFNTTKTKPKIQFFQGKQGLIKIMEMFYLHNPEKQNFIVGDIGVLFSSLTREERLPYKQQRIKKAIHNYVISTNNFEELKDFSCDDPKKHEKDLREIRIAPKGLKIPFKFFVSHHKVALSSSAKEGYTIIFESPELSAGLKSLFKFLWGLSEPFIL